MLASNPYYNKTFFEVIFLFFSRLTSFFFGDLKVSEFATDDIQILVMAGVAASSSLLGTFLVLRRMTMLANSLSHTVLMGIVIAFVWNIGGQASGGHSSIPPMQALLFGSVIMGFVTTFLTEFLNKIGRLQVDASIGFVFTTLFALGVVLLTILTKDAHIGTEAVMGNADSLHSDDLFWVYVILAVNLFLFWLFFKEFQITTFDPALATALGFSNVFFNYLLMTQVSITVIGAFRAVGVLLVLAFMTGPVLTARLLTHQLKKMLWLSVAIGVSSALIGTALSRHLLTVYGVPLSTSGIVVCVITLIYFITILFNQTLALRKPLP